MPTQDFKKTRRVRNLFDPKSLAPFRLSRSRLENYLSCPRCFYLDRRLGIEPPAMPAFTLNSAVDELLKREFDHYRRQKEPHPLMAEYKIPAIPFAHPLMEEWRDPFQGVRYHDVSTNFILFGAVDDIWVDHQNQLYVVDYKATSTTTPITLDSEYRQAYKRQMEIYQWLLRKQNFHVSNTGYFVYCNANRAKPVFNNQLAFDIQIITYQGSDQWVQNALQEAYQCLRDERMPTADPRCEYCQYRQESYSLESKESFSSRKETQQEFFE